MNLDETIQHFQEAIEEQINIAHMHEDMMVFNQSIEHNTEAEYHKDLMNDCIKSGEELEQLMKWLKELKAYRKMYHKEHEDDYLRIESEGE